ncbi:hypothetical protein LR48_Vigan845s001800 [Vigna angularis]|uniref:Gnk2-homologous domain-containing protein n=2 Tax=Phaseolus angularis TaxID=3914 RepID=A0A0L9THI0_PHAAN|nr:plasmodesmata-located protein 2 [Vigna angularis]KAG2402214.1 uncharacterized protein HKW66_Vig0234100 [Vigna angularis]KOM29990.1 hypothetical protein LR48_Vigan845s001800 [Vigna angularis]
MTVSHSTILLTLTFFLFLPSSNPLSDYTTLVYKTCATQTFNNHQLSLTLNSLFQQLIAQSSQHKFFRTTEAVDDDRAISGLFQCRDHISKEECFSCVNLLPQMSNTLCSDSISARVQLDGCYFHYETEETAGESRSNSLLHKECGKPAVEYAKFKEVMEEAFATLESGILNSNGFYSMNYKWVKIMAQCEGDLETCDCSSCVNDAVLVGKEECGSSLSAQIYLDSCFISYDIFGNSVPGARRNGNTERLAAIIVGGAVAVFVGFALMSMLKSRFRKDEYE